MFIVQTNVPLPTRKGATGPRGSKYPFATMEIGDSFFVASSPEKEVKATTLRSAASAFLKNDKSRRFSIRDVVEDGNAGVRVWRVALKDDTPADAPAA